MPRATEPRPLTKTEARLLWLHAQRLDTSEPFGAGPQAVAAAVDHLGYVQIDTIHVIERCHHHILYSRIPAYARDDLRQAQSADKSVFEYWTHALSYVPAKDFRFFVAAMREHRREGHRWFASVKPEDTRKVMRLLRRDGALTIRDIDDDASRELLVRLHQRVAAGESPPAALRGAQLELRASKDLRLSDSRTWAGFVAIGGAPGRTNEERSGR